MLGMLATTLAIEPLPRTLLALLLAAPLLGMLLVLLSRRDDPRANRDAALAASLLALLLAAAVVAVHLLDPAAVRSTAPFGRDVYWPMLRSSLALGVDGISVWLVAMTAVLMPAAVLVSAPSIRRQARAFYALLMLLESAMLGVFLVRDLLWFYIFFEFTLIPLFFIIGIWGGPDRRRAAFTFFIYTLAGTTITLATFLYMGYRSRMDFGFDALAAALPALPAEAQVLLFVGLFVGFAIKVPLFPLHTWLPLAHTEAPTAGSVVLAGVLLKLGAYGFLRIGVGFLPKAALIAAPAMGVLAVIGILYGALAAWVQSDFKKLIAYSSIAHLGFCMLGMFAMRPAGMTGSVLVMVNHGLSTGALFLLAGMIHDRYHTHRFADLGGLARRMPVLAFFMVFFALSSLGLPGLNGFVSEFLVLVGTAASGRAGDGLPATLGLAYAAPAALGVVLSAVYLLHLVGRLMFGPLVEPAPSHAAPGSGVQAAPNGKPVAEPGTDGTTGEGRGRLPPDADGREWAILAPLAALVLLLGLWPAPVTRSIDAAVAPVLERLATANSPQGTCGPQRSNERGATTHSDK